MNGGLQAMQTAQQLWSRSTGARDLADRARKQPVIIRALRRFRPAGAVGAIRKAGLEGRCALAGIEHVWRETLGDPRVCIAIVDGPVDLSHPCLAGAQLSVLGAAGVSCRGHGACSHGTHVASLIFAGHGSGPLGGVAPGCRGIVVSIFRDDSSLEGGVRPCGQQELARAIEAAVGAGAQVINISAGEPGGIGAADRRLRDAIDLCHRRGVLVVAAAGNEGCDCVHVPAALPMVLSVGAHDADGSPSAASNFGSAYRRQGLVAPGAAILGAAPGGRFVKRSGTSFAAPLVAGLAGLLLSARLKQRGHLKASDVRDARDALLRSASICDLNDRRDCRRLLVGRANPVAALNDYTRGGTPDGGIDQRSAIVVKH